MVIAVDMFTMSMDIQFFSNTYTQSQPLIKYSIGESRVPADENHIHGHGRKLRRRLTEKIFGWFSASFDGKSRKGRTRTLDDRPSLSIKRFCPFLVFAHERCFQSFLNDLLVTRSSMMSSGFCSSASFALTSTCFPRYFLV